MSFSLLKNILVDSEEVSVEKLKKNYYFSFKSTQNKN